MEKDEKKYIREIISRAIYYDVVAPFSDNYIRLLERVEELEKQLKEKNATKLPLGWPGVP